MSESALNVILQGVRGSIPTPYSSNEVRQKLQYALRHASPKDLESTTSIDAFIDTLPAHIKGSVGGNSCCVEMIIDGNQVIFDGGTGCYPLGKKLITGTFGEGKGIADWFFTHTHLDHIIGLPMFSPLYVPGNKFNFLAPYSNLLERFSKLMDPQFFPVQFEDMPSEIQFTDLSDKSEVMIGNTKIRWHENDHPGQSFSYRVEHEKGTVVLSTDAEYKDLSPQKLGPVIEFFKDADVLIFDAQYAFTESVQLKRDWGHSSSFVGIDLALDSGVKKLVLFHHEPEFDDLQLHQNLIKAQTYLSKLGADDEMEIMLAHEGLSFNFS